MVVGKNNFRNGQKSFNAGLMLFVILKPGTVSLMAYFHCNETTIHIQSVHVQNFSA